LPDLNESIHEEYADQGVRVIGLHPGENQAALNDFVAQTGVEFELIRDEGTRNAFNWADGTGYPYPRDVVVGKDLTILSVRNSFNAEEVEALVREQLELD
jgi:hypothetical protein